MNIDIEEFVKTGTFGSLGTTPTREMVHALLGPSDSDGYPDHDHDHYGNVAIEFGEKGKAVYRIMIAFAHSLNERYLPSNCDMWPDSRFTFTLGCFAPDAKFRDIVNQFPNFEHADMVGDFPAQILIYSNRQANVDLCFAPATHLADHTLYCIVSHPDSARENSAG